MCQASVMALPLARLQVSLSHGCCSWAFLHSCPKSYFELGPRRGTCHSEGWTGNKVRTCTPIPCGFSEVPELDDCVSYLSDLSSLSNLSLSRSILERGHWARCGKSILLGTVSEYGPALRLLCHRAGGQVHLLGLRSVISLLVTKLRT